MLDSGKDEYSEESFNLNCLIVSKICPYVCQSVTIVLRCRYFGAQYLDNSSKDSDQIAPMVSK